MKKKVYLSPKSSFIELDTAELLAGSTGATIPDAGWGNSQQKQHSNAIWQEDEEQLFQ